MLAAGVPAVGFSMTCKELPENVARHQLGHAMVSRVSKKEHRMFAPANTAHFTLALPRLDHDFKVLAFQGTEAISQPYSFDLDLVRERPDLDIEVMQQHPEFLYYAWPATCGPGLIHSP